MDDLQQLTPDAARSLRLRSLLLVSPPISSGPPSSRPLSSSLLAVVEWFGAMQAQDVRSLLWSLGVRLPGATSAAIQQALEARGVLRTWPMRGTLHLVPARDARWMVELMAGRRMAVEVARRAELGLSETDVDRAVDVLGAALAGGGRLARSACVALLEAAGLPVAGQAAYHLLGAACRRGALCLAPDVGAEQTFVLLDEWAPGQRTPDRDEALATVTLRYVRSHGPVHRRDLAGWTGLALRDVDRGLAAVANRLRRVTVEGTELIAAAEEPAGDAGGHLVPPGFDELVLGYKDRSLLMSPGHLRVVVPGGNGMFRSTLVRDGRVIGVWTRSLTRGRLVVHPQPLEPLTPTDRTAFEDAFAAYAAFAGADALDVRWP